MVLLTVIIAMLFAVLTAGQRSWFTGGPQVELRQGIIQAAMFMDREASQTRPTRTNLTSIGSTSTSLVFTLPNDNNGDGSIVDSMGGIEWGPNSITYALNAAGQLIRTAAGVTKIFANNITSVRFTRTGPMGQLLVVDMTAQKTAQNERLVQDSEEVIIEMRN